MQQFELIKSSADLVYDNQDHTSATILYFKSIFTALDFIIVVKLGRSPKDHSERFKILKTEFPAYYEKLDLTFQVYRDTYSKSISKQTCEEIKSEAEYFIEAAKES